MVDERELFQKQNQQLIDETVIAKINYSFFMNIANCDEYADDVRATAKEWALSIGTELGIKPKRKEPIETENSRLFK